MKNQRIDIHTHILPRDLPKWKEKFGYGGFVQLEHLSGGPSSCRAKMMKDDGTFFREISSNCWDPLVRTKECDENNVTMQVLSTVPVLFSYWAKSQDGYDISRFLNDHLAEVVMSHPTRFIGLGTLPLQSPALAIKELERCKKELRFAGVQIGSNVNGLNLNDPRFLDVFAAAEELSASIFVHPWDMLGADRMKQYWMPWLVGMPTELSLAICSMIFGGVLEKFPQLRIAFAHGGGSFPGTFGRIRHGFYSRPDLCAIDNPYSPEKYLKRIVVDSLVHDRHAFELILKLFGPSQIACGSDYPFPLGEARPGELIESMTELSQNDKEQMLWRTAEKWLGMMI